MGEGWETVSGESNRIFELKKTEEIEKFKFVLDKRDIADREEEIAKWRISNMN